MESKLYGFILNGDREEIAYMPVYHSLEELVDENDVEDGKVFIFELKDYGVIEEKRSFTFKSKKKATKKAK